LDLLAEYRSRDGSFDCVVPGSGGKDSSYVSHQLKYKYGMHPLTVTWAPFMYTDVGWQNYVAFKDHGFDNLLCFPDGIIHRKLTRLAFELLETPGTVRLWPEGVRLPHRREIQDPADFLRRERRGRIRRLDEEFDKPAEPVSDWKNFYYKGSGLDELVEHGLQAGLLAKDEVANHDFMFYRPPSEAAMAEVKPSDALVFLFTRNGCRRRNYYYSVDHTGFQSNFDGRSEGTYSKYASLDDKTDGFHFYLAYIKFGIARATSDAAHEIRDGHFDARGGRGPRAPLRRGIPQDIL